MSKITNFTRFLLGLLLTALAGGALIFSSAFLYLSPNLPPVDALRDIQLQTPLRIYSRNGELIGEFGEKRRTPISFEDIPTGFAQAILAAEDDAFYQHPGVDIKGLLRAATQLATTGSIQSGGSTITMQVAKNYFLSHERTFSRKFNEIFLALQIEQELSKQEILALYLNKIFLGNRAYGIEAAAKVYYGKSIDQLELAQWAMIAGLPKAPSAYNPIVNPTRAIIRRNWILGRMLELDHIEDEDYEKAINSPISARYHGAKLALNAPYIAEMVRKEAIRRFGKKTYTAGYKVHTTVDIGMQASAQRAVVKGLNSYDLRHGYRGPEQQLTPQSESGDTAGNLETWQRILSQTPTLGGLLPAAVTAVEEQSIDFILADGNSQRIEWQSGLNNIRRYLSVNSRSAAAKNASSLVAVGDLIRVQQDGDGNWQLRQVPDAQAALVSLDSDSGAILSLVGGYDYAQSKFNRVTQAARQPGSNFKPFVYTAALDSGYTPASIINDAPIVFDDSELESTWRPTNSGGRFLGPTRLRKALYQSRNLVSIRLLQSLGINNTIDYVSRFGFNAEQLPRNLSLALGSANITPMKIVSAYAILANGGYGVSPYLIQRIETADGEELFSAQPGTVCRDCELAIRQSEDIEENTEKGGEVETLEELLAQVEQPEELSTLEEVLDAPAATPQPPRIVEARAAYLIDSMLRDVVKRGTGRKALSLKRGDLAGKTGTTNGPTDAWFSGYGGGITTTAWLGFDNNALLGSREYGGSAALPIWIDFMRTALDQRPEFHQKQPDGLVNVKIDPTTGLLAKPGQSDAIFEIFQRELAPSEQATDGSEAPPSEQEAEAVNEDIF